LSKFLGNFYEGIIYSYWGKSKYHVENRLGLKIVYKEWQYSP